MEEEKAQFLLVMGNISAKIGGEIADEADEAVLDKVQETRTVVSCFNCRKNHA